MDPLTVQLFRVDPLTGCNNFLSFVERLDQLASETHRAPFALLAVDMNYLYTLNATKGHAYGDSTIRWMELVLREECRTATYRLGGDEFAVLLENGSAEEYESILHNIYARLSKEAPLLGIPAPVASLALIHFEAGSKFSPLDALTYIDKGILDIKTNHERGLQTYSEKDLAQIIQSPDQISENDRKHVDWITSRLIKSFISLGQLLDDAQQAAYIDSTSGLPNIRAAMHKLEQALSNARVSDESFSLVLMDGDNLRFYNEISYAAGDEMIRRMSVLLSSKLRPGDFIARWRSGDEFIAILPSTSRNGALIVGNRFRAAIKEASQAWEFPTSISVGIAIYPNHGTNIKTLIDKAELAMKQAKDRGKDQIVIAE